MPQKAIIIGAGPAGLTAAFELLTRTNIVPIIIEKSGDIGGISKTVNYKGNRIDIGGHRFFSKSDRVMEWWLKILPVDPTDNQEFTISYQHQSRTIRSERIASKNEEGTEDKIMLVRRRLSRIYFMRKFFAYPLQLSIDTLQKLGLIRAVGILYSYLLAKFFPRKPEKSLEDFFINRFGHKLYQLFFKTYTEKVWGVPCTEISSEWGRQRIKGISIGKAIAHAARSISAEKGKVSGDIRQKNTETSFVDRFLYPKLGPGQLWEEVAKQVCQMGGSIFLNHDVRVVESKSNMVTRIEAIDGQTGVGNTFEGDYFFSTMPVNELVAAMGDVVPLNVRDVSNGLQYRDFLTVGILLKKMSIANETDAVSARTILPDTWIYIQEADVRVGRLQIFNNWSPFMVNDPNTVWIGMEYFCQITDEFWIRTDDSIKQLAIEELEKIGLAKSQDVLDSTVLRMEKTYPAYFGTYNRFSEVTEFTDQFTNLFLVGRNGMHKYNNSDHSMLTAMVAVDNIIEGVLTKSNLWCINTEQEYHEEKVPVRTSQEGFIADRWITSLFSTKRRKQRLFWLAGIAMLLQFVIFKYFYPQAGFINADSYVYIQTAMENRSINIYPVGYSNFLRLFSVFTYSDLPLVAFQYLLLQVSSLFLIFTVARFYKPAKWILLISYLFVLFNPVWLCLANYVSSDALFVGVSILWFATLLWLIERPSNKLLIIQISLLFFLFTIRYNALYYPIITTIALILAKRKWYWKFTGISLSFAVIGLFIWHTTNEYKEQTGIDIFSPFSGWQLANNAMYAYRYVDSASRKPVPLKFSSIDRRVRHYFDTSRNLQTHPTERIMASTFYMWEEDTPLQQYMANEYGKDSSTLEIRKWAAVAPLYFQYGSWLIRSYPREFLLYYLYPNLLKCYAPQVEYLDTYNMGTDTVAKMARVWFHYRHRHVKTRAGNLHVGVLDFYPILVGALNVIFLVGFVFFILLRGFKGNRYLSKAVILVSGFWLINFGFSVFVSPVTLRFQLFPALTSFVFSLIFLEYIIKMAFNVGSQNAMPSRSTNLA